MYCKKCGKQMVVGDIDETGICRRCRSEERMRQMSAKEVKKLSLAVKKSERKTKRRRRAKKAIVFLVVLISGFFCPLIWILYGIFKARAKRSYPYENTIPKEDLPYCGRNGNGMTTSSGGMASNKNGFLITGGDGNMYESGGLFCDWAGNYLEWGCPFHDARGNLVEWGSPFYDNRDNYVGWGSPFYDAGDNYINPHG